jgi:hypothetical protein
MAALATVRRHLPLLLHQPAQHGCHSDPSIAGLRHEVLPFGRRRERLDLSLGESGVKQGGKLIRLHVITLISQSANCRTRSVSKDKSDGQVALGVMQPKSCPWDIIALSSGDDNQCVRRNSGREFLRTLPGWIGIRSKELMQIAAWPVSVHR